MTPFFFQTLPFALPHSPSPPTLPLPLKERKLFITLALLLELAASLSIRCIFIPTFLLNSVVWQEVFDSLRSHSVFGKMDSRRLFHLSCAFRTVTYRKHSMLFREGSLSPCFYLLVSGEVALMKRVPQKQA